MYHVVASPKPLHKSSHPLMAAVVPRELIASKAVNSLRMADHEECSESASSVSDSGTQPTCS